MYLRNVLRLFTLAAFALAALSLLYARADAQKGPQSATGAPLKGVDVKLGRSPGGSPAARTATDAEGNFSLPVVPEGEYILTLELKKDTAGTQAARASSAAAEAVRLCRITLKLPGGEKVEKEFDLAQNKAFDPPADAAEQSAAKMKLETFVVHSDGATPLNGTIVKSKSNITNN